MQSGVLHASKLPSTTAVATKGRLLILGVAPKAGSTIKDIDIVMIGPSRDAVLLHLVYTAYFSLVGLLQHGKAVADLAFRKLA